MAKGYIVDRAIEEARAVPGVRSVLVNAGGRPAPRRPGQHHRPDRGPAPPVRERRAARPAWRSARAALATSGTAHRGFRVGERWFGHVLDPRTGWPVQHTASASVIAADTATADAVATVVMVLRPEEGLGFADSLDGVAALLIGDDGAVYRSRRWPDSART